MTDAKSRLAKHGIHGALARAAALWIVVALLVMNVRLYVSDDPTMLEMLTQTTATLVGAYVGAWMAVHLTEASADRRDLENQVTASRMALLASWQQVNALAYIKRQILDPAEELPRPEISMKAVEPRDYSGMLIDIGSLSFLDDIAGQSLLVELSIENDRFLETIQAINARSQYHREVVQPAIATLLTRFGPECQEHLPDLLGLPVYPTIKRLTENVQFHVKATQVSAVAANHKLYDALKERFANAVFVKADVPTAPSDTSQTNLSASP